jgi:hypothetical protein
LRGNGEKNGVNPEGADVGNRCFAGDLNGDGKTDIACYVGRNPNHSRKEWSVALSTGSGWNTTTFHNGPDVEFPIGNQCLTGDFDGDGRTDVSCYSGPETTVNWHTAISTGTNFATPRNGAIIGLPDRLVTSRCVTGDFNADGRKRYRVLFGEWSRRRT